MKDLNEENLDDQLRSALRRRDPSPEFIATVLQRAETRNYRLSLRTSVWASAAIAAMLILGFTGVTEYRQQQQEQAGRRAMVALRITSEKLNHVRDRVLSQSSPDTGRNE